MLIKIKKKLNITAVEPNIAPKGFNLFGRHMYTKLIECFCLQNYAYKLGSHIQFYYYQ